MKSNLVIKLCTVFIVIGCIMTACTKMDGTYKDFLKGGEKIYSARPDSIQIFPGHNRIKLSWLLISDPNIIKCRVYWNNGADSVEIPIEKGTSEIDSINVILDNLAEGSYTFSLYTYDKLGNPSIVKDTTGHVYGDEYISTLLNRQVNNAALVGGKPRIAWYDEQDTTALGVEARYKDQGGVLHEIWVPLSDQVTRIEERPLGDSVQYRTLFLPDSLAIDTFYAPYQTLKLEKAVPIELDKSKFSELKLPTDAPADGHSYYVLSNLWDGKLDAKQTYRVADGSGVPHWYTFDMGLEANLDHYVFWQRGTDRTDLFYANANPKIWEVWGSNDPNPDGSWDSWTKLMDCTSIKPSGSPLGTNTAEDIQQAKAGETFTFPANTPPVRYIRIKILEDWAKKDSDHSFIAELTFYGVAE